MVVKEFLSLKVSYDHLNLFTATVKMSLAKQVLSNLSRMPRQASLVSVRCMSGNDEGNKAGETLSKKGAADQVTIYLIKT